MGGGRVGAQRQGRLASCVQVVAAAAAAAHTRPRNASPPPPHTHPTTTPAPPLQLIWTFSILLEAVAILPQLVLMQRTQNIDNLTANYVALLG